MVVFILTLVLLAIIVLIYISVRSSTNMEFAGVESSNGMASGTESSGLIAHFGDRKVEEEPDSDETEIKAQYAISYAKRIYIEDIFTLRVNLGRGGTTLTVEEGSAEAARGPLSFTHKWYHPKETEEPLPQIQVELKFADGDFQISRASQIKPLDAKTETVFAFLVKPLKSTDLFLQVEIAYVGVEWRSQMVTEITVAEDARNITTTKKMTPAGLEKSVKPLASEDLVVEVKSFLNMNAASLGVMSKIIAVVLTVIYVGLVFYLGLTDSLLETGIVGITVIAGIFGIPIADNTFTKAQIKKQAAENTG